MTTQNMLTAVSGFPRTADADYFAADDTPDNVRDPSVGFAGMVIAALVHIPSAPMEPAGEQGFIMGCCSDVADERGYSIAYEDSGHSVIWRVGDIQSAIIPVTPAQSGRDHALIVGCTASDGNDIGMFLFVNGFVIGGNGPVTWLPELTRPFTVGNSIENLEDWGLLDGGVIAVATGPYNWPVTGAAAQQSYDALQQLWAETERAGDIIDQQGIFDHVWSCRRGLTNIVDGGNEQWVDWRGGTVMSRQGTQTGLSVGARESSWMKVAAG